VPLRIFVSGIQSLGRPTLPPTEAKRQFIAREMSDIVFIVLPVLKTHYTLNVCIRFLGCAAYDLLCIVIPIPLEAGRDLIT
jgi:hypothetical protein